MIVKGVAHSLTGGRFCKCMIEVPCNSKAQDIVISMLTKMRKEIVNLRKYMSYKGLLMFLFLQRTGNSGVMNWD